MVVWNSHVNILTLIDVSILHACFIVFQLFERYYLFKDERN